MTVTTFSELELDENLLEALQDKGFTRPTAIQAAAIPPALDGRDILGSAPTGTGKTAAYLLPALQHLLDFPRKKSGPPRILILTPTRETAIGLTKDKQGDSKVRIDGTDGHKVAELAHLMPMQLITPEGFTLLNGGPKYRRAFQIGRAHV